MQLRDLECPNCGASELFAGDNGQLICAYCSSAFGEVTRLCPQCGYYNEVGARHCSRCGTALVRDCPVCGTDNWVLADHCVQCGRNLDLIDEMVRRWQRTTAQWLQERRAAIPQIQEAEEKASRTRMSAWLEEERQQQEAMALAQEASRKRDRQFLFLMALVVVAFLVIMIVALLVTFGS
jgi:hypothetical protein